MRIRLVVLLALSLSFVADQPLTAQSADPHMQRAIRVLRSTPLIDGHNDLPWAIRESRTAPLDIEAYDLRQRTPGHTDLERLS
ncbi:MAG: membrane dipeptidase, partial [Longimicrobiaceae bacterium]